MKNSIFLALLLAGCSINHRIPDPVPHEFTEADWSPWVLKENESGPNWSRKLKCRYAKNGVWLQIQCVSDYEKTTTIP